MSVARSKHLEKVQARVDWLSQKLANWRPGTVRDENIRRTMREELEALQWLLKREAHLHGLQEAETGGVRQLRMPKTEKPDFRPPGQEQRTSTDAVGTEGGKATVSKRI